MTKKDVRILIAIAVFICIELVNALTIAGIAFDLIYEGCHEVPQDIEKLRGFFKRVVMLTSLKMKKIRDKVMGHCHSATEDLNPEIKLEMEEK